MKDVIGTATEGMGEKVYDEQRTGDDRDESFPASVRSDDTTDGREVIVELRYFVVALKLLKKRRRNSVTRDSLHFTKSGKVSGWHSFIKCQLGYLKEYFNQFEPAGT